MLFSKKEPAVTVTEIPLSRQYRFMYHNFVLDTPSALYVVLAKTGDTLHALKFTHCRLYKSGYPNDEAAHPLAKYGLGFYGLFQVHNSPWLAEIVANNRLHPRHSDNLYADVNHYIARFKDETIEVLAHEMEEVQLSPAEINQMVQEQLRLMEAESEDF